MDKTNNLTSYSRGSVGNAYLRRDYSQYAASPRDAEDSTASQLLAAYFNYHVTKLGNLYVASGETDIKSLTTVLTTICRMAFTVFLSKNRDEVRASERIKGRGSLSRRHAVASKSPATRLGVADSCESGINMILGQKSAEAVARLIVTMTISETQLRTLRENPMVLGCILNAFEKTVPLNLDYCLMFSVRELDRNFELGQPAVRTATAPLLGITSALGTDKSPPDSSI
jgi:hypothetical protein